MLDAQFKNAKQTNQRNETLAKTRHSTYFYFNKHKSK